LDLALTLMLRLSLEFRKFFNRFSILKLIP